MNPRVALVLILALVLAAGGAVAVYLLFIQPQKNQGPGRDPNTFEVERTDYHPPAVKPDDELADDRLEDKTLPAFDPALADRRPLGRKGEWLLNASAAVLRLDVPLILPDQEPALLTLHPSYAAAVGPHPEQNGILPSVNLIDGKAKQFDDGLYAAVDQAYYKGLEGKLTSHVQLVKRMLEKAGPESVAAPFLAAGLELAGVKAQVKDSAQKEALVRAFQANPVASKPIGFYTWNSTLTACFRFMRFFQRQFDERELAIPVALAAILARDQELAADYRKAVYFYERLTNPSLCLSVADLGDGKGLSAARFAQLCQEKKVFRRAVALLPPSASREVILFEKLFGGGLPPDADLMRALVHRIRSGEVKLKPQPESGWYDYQVYALETLLLPEKGEERNKLLLTRAYKKRMLEAFKALITKRRETHSRMLDRAEAASTAPPPPLENVEPRLRLEPCPSYYLRTARSYAFLANLLEATLGKDGLEKLHGLKKQGERPTNLQVELHQMRDLFYGLYLVSAEDIGLKPALAQGEVAQPDACYQAASRWLAQAFQDPDLAMDTRVSIPILVDVQRKVTRIWVTLGVRLTRLNVSYAVPPRIKPALGGKEWKAVEAHRLRTASYLIPVDEFAEIELSGLKALSRKELRAICDREKTREAIIEALRRF